MATDRKVYIVAYDYPPCNGGIARLCFEIKKGLINKNIPVEVVASYNNGTDLQDDIYVTRIQGKRPKLELNIFNYLRKNVTDKDIVITDTWHPSGLLACLACKNVYVLAHGLEYISWKSKLRRLFINIIGKRVLSTAKGVIANSHFTGDLVSSVSPNANVKVIPLAVDPEHFRPTQKKYEDDILHVFTISRLEKFKGHDFVINVVNKFNSIYPNSIKLSIGGKGPYMECLQNQVHSLGLDDMVTFEGFIPDDELCDHYSKNDLFILCTRQTKYDNNVEGFGLVFCEAQACGTPVIGTKTGGISDAVEIDNGGWLINQDNETELMNLLVKFYNDKSILKEEGRKARIRMENYDWSKYIENLLNYVRY